MKKKFLFFLIILSFQIFIININTFSTDSYSIVKPLQLSPGTLAPNFTLTDIMTEATFSLRDFHGKVVILDFFATWCGYCTAAIPDMREIYYNHSTEELVIISIDIDTAEEKDLVLSYATNYQMDWVVALDNNSIWDSYGSGYIPTMYIIDQTQTITYSEIGFNYENILNTLNELGLESSTTSVPDISTTPIETIITSINEVSSPRINPLVIFGILSIVPIVGIVIILVVKLSEKLASRDVTPPVPWKSIPDKPQIQYGIQFCHNCGSKADLSDRFCINCGSRLD